MTKIIVLAGVTATGKSDLAIQLAKGHNGEIISADSVSVYRQLNIGSAKPSLVQRQEVRHHLIDIRDLDERYDVVSFQRDARTLIEELTRQKIVPIIAGGTGLYLKALIDDYRFESDPLPGYEGLSALDPQALHAQLKQLDPQAAADLHPNNHRRVLRALARRLRAEESRDLKNGDPGNERLQPLVLFLHADRQYLYQRIEQRVDAMIAAGLADEVAQLNQDTENLFSLQSMQAIGYKEFRELFARTLTLEETVALIKRNTRRFAKRQLTWFRHQLPCEWIDIQDPRYRETIRQKVIDHLREN